MEIYKWKLFSSSPSRFIHKFIFFSSSNAITSHRVPASALEFFYWPNSWICLLPSKAESTTQLHEKLLFLSGIAAAYGVSIAPPIILEGSVLMMFFAGSIALCAMILPGISGSFILVLLGLYPVFIDALAEFKVDILVAFASGGVLGLMLFSRLLSWILVHYRTAILVTMCGFLIGSLNVIWPWKSVVSSMVTDSGKTLVLSTQNLWPSAYAEITKMDPQTTFCVLLFVFGAFLVFGLERLGKVKSKSLLQG